MVGSETYDWDYLILDLGGKGNETEEAGEVELGFVLLADFERRGHRRLKGFFGGRTEETKRPIEMVCCARVIVAVRLLLCLGSCNFLYGCVDMYTSMP